MNRHKALSVAELDKIHSDAHHSILTRDQIEHLFAHINRMREVLGAINGITMHQTNRVRFGDDHPTGDPEPAIPHQVHPLTCGNSSNHTPLYPFYNVKLDRIEMHCRDCGYTQLNGAMFGV